MIRPIGLYAHFPWCVRKCPYCDFNSHPLRGSLNEAGYVSALIADLRSNLPGDVNISTVFFGGGTPSLFQAESFAALLEEVAPQLAEDAEVTMEANPGTTEHSDLRAYREAGINRLSIGAQSFDDAALKRLGRIHHADETSDCATRARAAGFENINIDLMYGLPHQTPDQAIGDLEAALALAPEHISWYQLTIEPRTEFARRPPQVPHEDEIAETEHLGRERLEEAGFERYEVSAYARPYRLSRHNVNYWSFGDYVGIGAGAHGKLTTGRTVARTVKASQPRLYLQDPESQEQQNVDADLLPFEFMLNALRLRDGVPLETFKQRTGLSLEVLDPIWGELADEGLVHRHRIATTPEGYRYLDSVISRFLS
ncbi:MAG: radical SAM family heme chaperone HemW [Pseudomonadales bacterium]|nr:radical SAM family heme chaperone HemW [Pseudomonadales bacterium]NIX07605.1 radical SAM family heme chaperone HemW [Pseudomonadales bacterium]